MKRLEGKTALITGAASGIGRASAILFASEGANVVVLDRAPAVEDAAATIRSAGGTASRSCGFRRTRRTSSRRSTRRVREFGALDVCFANAGVSGGLVAAPGADAGALGGDPQDQPDRDLPRGEACSARDGAAKRGSIICTASVAGLRSGAGGSPYSASKAGVISLVQTTAYQLGGSGVRINAICPGLIETGMTRPIFETGATKGTDHKIGQLNPLRRAGAPEEIAQMALFLASDDPLTSTARRTQSTADSRARIRSCRPD